MAILWWSKYARIALERVGIFLDAPPPPPPPRKIEVTFDQLEKMEWNEMKEDQGDDFRPNMIYDVGGSDSDDSVFKYFNPKGKKDGNTTKASVI